MALWLCAGTKTGAAFRKCFTSRGRQLDLSGLAGDLIKWNRICFSRAECQEAVAVPVGQPGGLFEQSAA